MRAARWLLFSSVVVVVAVWAISLASLVWPPGAREEDLGLGILWVAGFVVGHGSALALATTASLVAAVALGRPAARTVGGYATLASCAAAATLIGAYLGFFVGCWGG